MLVFLQLMVGSGRQSHIQLLLMWLMTMYKTPKLMMMDCALRHDSSRKVPFFSYTWTSIVSIALVAIHSNNLQTSILVYIGLQLVDAIALYRICVVLSMSTEVYRYLADIY